MGYTITFLHSDPITIYHGKKGDKGDKGDTGEQGDKGEQGEQGEQGIPGQDGVDGADGQDGYTPQIGLTQKEDGNWYWTLDGQLMLDPQGNPIRANGEDGKDGQDGADGENGQDGIPGQDGQPGADGEDGKDAPTPQIRLGSSITAGTIMTDNGTKKSDAWYLSVDDGKTWYRISGEDGEDGNRGPTGPQGPTGPTGPAGSNGKPGDSMFADPPITDEGTHYTFHLADEDSGPIIVPKYQPLQILTEAEHKAGTASDNGIATVPPGGETTFYLRMNADTDYKNIVAIVTPLGDEAVLTRATPEWIAAVRQAGEDITVTITAPATAGKALLDVSLLRADGSKLTASRVLEVPIVKGGQTLTEAGDYTMRGNYTQGITINGDGINLTLNGATINTSGIGIDITGGNPTIQVLGTENSVTSATSTAIHVGNGCTLTIEGVNGTADKLKAEGGKNDGTALGPGNAGAGIGSSNGGNIVIRNVTIEAKGNTYSHFTGPQSGGSAAIGSSLPGYCGDITIDNATITATGGYRAAAIGMSGCVLDNNYPDLKIGKIHISHSVITAQGGDGASAIGLAWMEDEVLSSAYAGEIYIETDKTSATFLGRLTSSGNFKIGKGKHYSDRMTFYNQDGSGTWPGVTLKASDGTQTSPDGINQ